jgi:hypothetical protein
VPSRARSLSPLPLLRRNAIYKGFLGGQRGWLAVGVVVWGARLARKALGRNEQVVATEKLKPGDTLVLRTIPQQTREQRRAARRET